MSTLQTGKPTNREGTFLTLVMEQVGQESLKSLGKPSLCFLVGNHTPGCLCKYQKLNSLKWYNGWCPTFQRTGSPGDQKDSRHDQKKNRKGPGPLTTMLLKTTQNSHPPTPSP